MPSTSDLFALALRDASRSGKRPQSLTDLAAFDPTAALKEYGAAAAGDFSAELDRNVGDLRGRSVGAGRLKTGFYDEDVGRLTTDIADRYQRDLSGQAMNAAGLKANTLQAAAAGEGDEQNRYLDLMSGQLDREQAARNARAERQGSLWGALGTVAGTIAGGPIGGAVANRILKSSERFKTNIEPLGSSETGIDDLGAGEDVSAMDRLERMPGVRFNWKETGEPDVGVIAEDVDRELPEASVRDETGRPTAVDYAKILPLVIEATREQAGEIREIRGELQRLASGGRLGDEAPPPLAQMPRRPMMSFAQG